MDLDSHRYIRLLVRLGFLGAVKENGAGKSAQYIRTETWLPRLGIPGQSPATSSDGISRVFKAAEAILTICTMIRLKPLVRIPINLKEEIKKNIYEHESNIDR